VNDRDVDEVLADEAVFETVRVSRGGRPVAAMAIAAVVGGLAVVGVLGGTKGAAFEGRPGWSRATAERPVDMTEADRAAAREAPWRTHPGTGEPFVARLLAIDARVAGDLLTLHGDVFTPLAEIVVIAVGDVAGRSTEVRSIELPGGSTAFRLGASDRFDVSFAIDASAEAVWVEATAYDATGNRLDSVRQSLKTALGQDRVPGVVDYGWPPTSLAGDAFAPVRLDRPAAGVWAASGTTIEVQGKLRIKADSVRVTLRTLDLDLLDSTIVDTSDPDGGVRPRQAPAIDVALSLGRLPAAGDRLWLVLTAYDEAGLPLGTMRRLVTIAAPAA
jgi:hypothetical protein